MDFQTKDEIKNNIKKLALSLKKLYNCNIKIEINFKGLDPLINITIFNI